MKVYISEERAEVEIDGYPKVFQVRGVLMRRPTMAIGIRDDEVGQL